MTSLRWYFQKTPWPFQMYQISQGMFQLYQGTFQICQVTFQIYQGTFQIYRETYQINQGTCRITQVQTSAKYKSMAVTGILVWPRFSTRTYLHPQGKYYSTTFARKWYAKQFREDIWVSLRRWACLVTWFCYHLIAKPGNKTDALCELGLGLLEPRSLISP